MISVSKNILDAKVEVFEDYEGYIIDYIEDEGYLEHVRAGYKLTILLNNKPLDYKDYGTFVTKEDNVIIVIAPEASYAFSFLLNMAISFAISYILKTYFTPDTDRIQDKGPNLNNLTIGKITLNKDGVIKDCYGENVIYPNLIAPIYKRFEDNEEVSYITTVIGLGKYSFDEIYLNKENVKDKLLGDNPKQCDGYIKDSVIKCFTDAQDSLKVKRFDGNVESFSFDSNYRYIVNELKDYQNYNLIDFDPDLKSEWTTPTRLDYIDAIDKVEIDISTVDGIYRIDDDGDSHSTTISFKYKVFQLDEDGNQKNIKEKTWSHTAHTGKKWRGTIELDIDEGTEYFISMQNLTKKPGTGDNISNGFIINRIKGLTTYNKVNSDDITYAIFKFKSGEIFKENTSLNLGLKATRQGLVKMNDVINNIWNSSGYNPIELSRTNEILSKYEVHGILDTKQPLYEQINRILRAQELILIPTLSGFKVKEDFRRDVLTYQYDKSKIIKGSLDIGGTFYNGQENDGFKSVYIRDGEQLEYTYPEDAYNPKAQFLIGVRNEADAKRHSIVGYKKMVLQNKVIKFNAGNEGYIPEVEDKISVSEFYINKSYVTEMYKSEGNKIYLKKEVLIEDNFKAKITTDEPIYDGIYEIINTDLGFTKVIELEGFNPDNINKLGIEIGEEVDIIKEYIVQEINPGEGEAIELVCQNYNEKIYEG